MENNQYGYEIEHLSCLRVVRKNIAVKMWLKECLEILSAKVMIFLTENTSLEVFF